MRDRLERLQIDVAFIERDTLTLEVEGQQYLRETDEAEENRRKFFLSAATMFRRAASHRCLLDEWEEASILFSKAAHAYEEAKLPYAYLISTLSSKSPDLSNPSNYLEEPKSTGTDSLIFAVLELVRADYPSEDLQLPFMDDFRAQRSKGLGTLGIPLNAFLRVAEFVSEIRSINSTRRTAPIVGPFLSAYDQALSQAREDQYHWQHLDMPFHPVEPDIVGTLRVLQDALEPTEVQLISIIKNSSISSESQSILIELLDRLSGPSYGAASKSDPESGPAITA